MGLQDAAKALLGCKPRWPCLGGRQAKERKQKQGRKWGDEPRRAGSTASEIRIGANNGSFPPTFPSCPHAGRFPACRCSETSAACFVSPGSSLLPWEPGCPTAFHSEPTNSTGCVQLLHNAGGAQSRHQRHLLVQKPSSSTASPSEPSRLSKQPWGPRGDHNPPELHPQHVAEPSLTTFIQTPRQLPNICCLGPGWWWLRATRCTWCTEAVTRCWISSR